MIENIANENILRFRDYSETMTSGQQNRLFRWLSPMYDHLIRRPEVERLRALLNLQPDCCLLDLGGGTGRVSKQFSKNVRTVVVGDINTSMLAQAKRKEGLVPLCLDAEELPFGNQTIDTILIVDAIHHFRHRRLIVDEVMRILKPTGRVVVEEQDINITFIKIFSLFERILGFHSSFLTPTEIGKLFDAYRHRKHVETGRFFTFWVVIEKEWCADDR